MADPAPTERNMPVGFRFHPTDQELVCHYLRHKLMADDPSIHKTVPEICLCKYEPQDLPARAASAVSATKFDDFQCYFFSPRDHKHPKGKRLNRTTSGGFWKVTGEDGIITDCDTNHVIGRKKHLVYYKGRGCRAEGTDWIVHEYYDDRLPSDQNTHVICWLKKKAKKKDGKKIKGKIRKGVANKRKSRNVNERNRYTNSNEFYTSNLNISSQPPFQINEDVDSMIQPSYQLNEATDSMIQPSSQLNEATDSVIQLQLQLYDSVIQPPPQLYEATDSVIQLSLQLKEATDSMIQPPLQLNEDTDSVIQPPFLLKEATDSVIQPSSQLNEATDSVIQPPSQLNETTNLMTQLPSQSNEVTYSIIQQTSQVDEALNTIIHTPLEPNFAVETFGEPHFSSFDQGEFDLGPLW